MEEREGSYTTHFYDGVSSVSPKMWSLAPLEPGMGMEKPSGVQLSLGLFSLGEFPLLSPVTTVGHWAQLFPAGDKSRLEARSTERGPGKEKGKCGLWHLGLVTPKQRAARGNHSC